MIASDIGNLIERALTESSPKEKLFYSYIFEGSSKSCFTAKTPIEQLCIDAFFNKVKTSETLVKLQRSKPIKNIHYSTNLIDLIAAASIDSENEKSHISSYLERHNLREAFLISTALGISIPDNVKIETPIDMLIHKVITKEVDDSVASLFTEVLLSSNHIFDAIVIKKLYELYLQVHPDSLALNEFDDLKYISKKISNVLNSLIMLALTISVSYLAVTYLNWSIENLKEQELISKIILNVFTVVLIIAIFLGLNIPSKVRALSWVRNKILEAIYFSLGLKYSKVKEILNMDK